MPFSAPFREPNIAPIFTPGGGVIPWYLLGGVTAAQCVAAYQPKGAADLAASYSNLNNPGTNNAAPGTAPTFAAATGWTFAAGSSTYLKTGVVPTNSYSAIIQYTNASVPAAVIFGGSNVNQFAILPRDSGHVSYWNGSTQIASPILVSGNLAIAGPTGYRNGASDVTSIVTGASLVEIYIGARNVNNSSVDSYFSGSVQAVAFYNVTLSSTQVGLIAAAMAAL